MSKEDILEAIAGLSVLELSELITAMEDKFGVSAAAAADDGDLSLTPSSRGIFWLGRPGWL